MARGLRLVRPSRKCVIYCTYYVIVYSTNYNIIPSGVNVFEPIIFKKKKKNPNEIHGFRAQIYRTPCTQGPVVFGRSSISRFKTSFYQINNHIERNISYGSKYKK